MARAIRKGRPWTQSEIDYLKANHLKVTHDVMATELNRTKPSVIRQITRLKLKRRWTAIEDQFIRENRYKKWPVVAKALNRSAVSVRSRAARLGVEKPAFKKLDVRRVRELYDQGIGTSEMARLMGCNPETTRKHLRDMNLPPNKRNEQKRLAVQRANYLKNYGVTNSAQARRVRAKRARLVAFELQVNSLSEALNKAEGTAACPS